MTTAIDTGGSPITSYNLQWDQGTAGETFVDVVGQADSPYLSTSYLVTAGITSGYLYQFKVQAFNKWGPGGFGPIATIRASTIPLVSTAPTVSVSGALVKVTWPPPNAQGSAITAYTIKFRGTDGNYYETSFCDGSLATVVSSRTCEVPMTAFRTTPYDLNFDDPILATVTATNADGTSLASPANSAGAAV